MTTEDGNDDTTRSELHASQIYQEIEAERKRQDARWGGAAHDDEHALLDWGQLLIRYVGLAVTAHTAGEEPRERLVQVAALAVAALESWDRKAAIVDELTKERGWVHLLGEYQAVEVVSGPFSGQRGYVMELLIDSREGVAMPLSYYVHLDDSRMTARIPHEQLRGLEWKHGAFYAKYPQYQRATPKET